MPCHLVMRVVVHAFDDIYFTSLRMCQRTVRQSSSNYARKATALHQVSTMQAIHLNVPIELRLIEWGNSTYHNPRVRGSSQE